MGEKEGFDIGWEDVGQQQQHDRAKPATVSFSRPQGVSDLEIADWEIAAARTAYQYARDGEKRQMLNDELTAQRIVVLLSSTANTSALKHLCQALAFLYEDKGVGLVYTDAGALSALATLWKARQDDPALLVPIVTAFANAAQSKRLVPKITHATIAYVPDALQSALSPLRIAAASLALALFAGGARVWDRFIQAGGVPALKALFRLANETEILLGLQIVDHLCDNERYMFHVRSGLTMEPIVLHSLSSNPDISAVAKHILVTSKYDQVWKGNARVDAYSNAMHGRGIRVMVKNEHASFGDALKERDRSGQEEAAKFLQERPTQYPFPVTYPQDKPQEE